MKPIKRSGGRRYYRSEDIDLLNHIRTLLYQEGYTIKGAQKVLKSYVKSNETNSKLIRKKNSSEDFVTLSDIGSSELTTDANSNEKLLEILRNSELRLDDLISKLSK